MYEMIPRIVMSLGRQSPTGVNILGTCFLTKISGCFATASHVTQGNDKDLCVILQTQNQLSDYQDATNNQIRCVPAIIQKIDTIHDTAIIKIDNPLTSSIEIGSLDQVNVGTEVEIFGYPHAEHGRKILTKQSADIGAKILLSASQAKIKHCVVNIQTRPGQSGSPIFIKGTNKVVAILVGSYAPGVGGISLGGIDPQTLHMTSHAVSAEYLGRML